MKTISERRFTIADAMLLIAATAVGLSVQRDWIAPVFRGPLYPLRYYVDLPYLLLAPLNFYWTLAFVAIRLRSPRPSPRRLGRQPGFIAGLAVILATLIHAVLGANLVFSARGVQWDRVDHLLLNLSPAQTIAPAVAVAWMVLAVSGRWRPNAGWIDRLGRFIGLTWLGILIYIEVKGLLFAIGVLHY